MNDQDGDGLIGWVERRSPTPMQVRNFEDCIATTADGAITIAKGWQVRKFWKTRYRAWAFARGAFDPITGKRVKQVSASELPY